MKYFLCLFCVVSFESTILAQQGIIDTTAVLYKAKLLTVSRFGLTNSDIVFEDIQQQSAKILPFADSNFLIVKVEFGQKYFYGHGYRNNEWLNSCNFYLAYNKQLCKYYRLGGFEKLDLDEFFDEVDSTIFFTDMEKITNEIDFFCLLDYVLLPKYKKKRRIPKCSPVCSDELTTHIIIPMKKKNK